MTTIQYRSMIADAAPIEDRLPELAVCRSCDETLVPGGPCLNVGSCRDADRAASSQSLRRGRAASSPAAWTISGGVD